MPVTDRTKRLKERCRFKHVAGGEYVDPEVRAGIERARYITEAHKANVGQPTSIARARGLENVLKKMAIHIQEDELTVGANTEHPDYFPLYPELSYFATVDMVESPYCENKEEMRAIAEYWRPYTIQTKGQTYFTQEELDVSYSATIVQPPMFVTAFSSCVPNYESILEDGLEQRVATIQAKIDEANAKMRESPWIAKDNLGYMDKIDKWNAMIIADKAVMAWAQRYARLAKIIAENFEEDDTRREELLAIADTCRQVPAKPPRGLRDAMQCKWFTYLICHSIERYASGYGQKEDKLMWPYYKMSVIDQVGQPMTREQAQELFECERLKVSEHGSTKGRQLREFFAGANDLFILTLGGLNADGSDGCNDCTDVILDAAASMKTTEPSIGFRWNARGREQTKRKVFECIKLGMGFPSIKHDENNIEQLMKYFHVPEEVANEWALVLCMSPGITGRRGTQKSRTEGGEDIYPGKLMELALANGFDHFFTDMQLGPRTGDAGKFTSMDEVWQSFRLQTRNAIDLALRAKDISRTLEATYLPCPFIGSLDDGCVEKGLNDTEIAEVPNPWHNMNTGSTCVIDSFAAMEKLIFDEKKYTMAQLVEALQANWEGHEEMRLDFWNAPKFGNDDEYADKWAGRYYNLMADEFSRIRTYSGAYPLPLAQSVAGYIVNGPKTGALPNGRHGGEALDDGGISPYMGCDSKGPTAVLKSVSKAPHKRFKGMLLNQRMAPGVMHSRGGFDLWHAYMKSWHKLNIDHVQFNVVSSDEMRAAQKEPEKHTDTIVRVAGYSAKFIDLATFSQETIIARTEHELGA